MRGISDKAKRLLAALLPVVVPMRTSAKDWIGRDQNSPNFVYKSTKKNGVELYNILWNDTMKGPVDVRILRPTNPSPGVAHNFLFVLPVQNGTENQSYGNGLNLLQSLNAQNQYNLTIIEPSFALVPWYADHPSDTAIAYDTFMNSQLVPWARSTFAATAHEQNWLIGFSKSGYGAIDLLLKYPTTFALAAAWDFPANMSKYDQYGDSANYGTDTNFQSNYRLTGEFVGAHKAPFTEVNRILISGYNTFRRDMADFDAMLTSLGMLHTFTKRSFGAHSWGAGWLPEALAALYDASLPTVTSFSIPRDYSSLTIPINSFVAIDSVGIAAYQLTEDSTSPSADDPGWSPFPPGSYTFSSAGKKTLYAWTKNAAGAVSTVISCSVTVKRGARQ
jgi:hypothetical protein